MAMMRGGETSIKQLFFFCNPQSEASRYACDIPSTRPLRPLVPFHISKKKHPHHCISRGGERQLTYGKAIEREVLLESDCSCDSSETLNKLNWVLEFPK